MSKIEKYMKILSKRIKNFYERLNSNESLDSLVTEIDDLLKINKNSPPLLLIKGICYFKLKKYDECEKTFKHSLEINPNDINTLSNYGVFLIYLSRYNESKNIYKSLIQLQPKNQSFLNNLGISYFHLGELDTSLTIFSKALEINDFDHNSLINYANSLMELGQLGNAEIYYKKSLSINQSSYLALYNLGIISKKNGDLQTAKSFFLKSIEINNNFSSAHNNLGVVLQEMGLIKESILEFQKSIELEPNNNLSKLHLTILYLSVCDWSNYKRQVNFLLSLKDFNFPFPPFYFLSLEDSPENQIIRSKKWFSKFKIQSKIVVKSIKSINSGKIKIGYFSSDFYEHPTMHLMAGLFKNHDKQKFEILIYNYSSKKSQKWINFLVNNGCKIINIDLKDINKSLNRIKYDQLDIAIDLKGYTHESRSDLFKYRLAPLQINYLGYPSTMGADCFDYIIADKTIIPPNSDLRKNYSEKIIYMPHCYQPNDDITKYKFSNSSRQQLQLPSDSLIYACFNNPIKITPIEFNIWTNILIKIENSYLWLLSTNDIFKENILFEIKKKNIDPKRVIFAPVMPHDKHLERLKLADIFLDCFNYNAHTTASDALRAGLPIVTKKGKQFSARVTASLLSSIKLDELITNSEVEYEKLIIKLSEDNELLKTIKEKVVTNTQSSMLFNPSFYANKYENLLFKAYERVMLGKAPVDIE